MVPTMQTQQNHIPGFYSSIAIKTHVIQNTLNQTVKRIQHSSPRHGKLKKCV